MRVNDWKLYGDYLATLLTICGKALDSNDHSENFKTKVKAIRRSCCEGLFETFATHTQTYVAFLSVIEKGYDTEMIQSFYAKLKDLVSYRTGD